MRSFRRLIVPGAVGVALLLAACGSSSTNSPTSSAAASSAAPSSTSSAAASGSSLTIGTASGSLGTYLTGSSGRALYAWKADSNDKSACSGACAKAWPPLTASAMPHVAGSVKMSDLTLITRSDGTKQVAYMGHPLYYFVGDSSAGSTKGEGSMGFGAVWDLVSPSGSPIAAHASSSGGSSGSSSGSSGSGWG